MTADPYGVVYENLLLDQVGTEGRVGRVTLNRPEKLNALSPELLSELNDALHLLESDYETRVIILRGSGRAFSAGYDISKEGSATVGATHRRSDPQGRPLVMGVRTSIQQVTDIQMYFWNMAKVTVAQLHGFALAGGCELAMMADLVVAAQDAQIGHPGSRFGTARTGNIWPLVVGMRKAKEMYYTGSSVSGTEAEEMGMINHAWAAEEMDERTVAYADHLANLSSDHLSILKMTMNRFYENMGIYSSVRSATDLDAASKFTAQAYEFNDRMAKAVEDGVGIGPVLDWRDAPYDDYRMKQRKEGVE